MYQEFRFLSSEQWRPTRSFEARDYDSEAGRTAGRLEGHVDLNVDQGEGVDGFKRHSTNLGTG